MTGRAAHVRTKRVSAGALDALEEAVASIYWYKEPFEGFVRRTVKRPEVLARLSFAEPKRRVAGQLVDLLAAQQDRYLDVLLDLMGEVCSFRDFSHLRRLDGGEEKARHAQHAVETLREHYEIHAGLEAAREEAAERRRLAREAAETRDADQIALEKLKQQLTTLLGAGVHRRGYALERLLTQLFALFDFDPKAAFRIDGEQIDGAFTFEGIDYLLEAKWQEKPVERADLDVFQAKITRKLENTLGLFIALNGFAPSGVQIHSGARPTMILMDGADLWAVLDGRIPLQELLKRKRRHAAQSGEIFLRYADF